MEKENILQYKKKIGTMSTTESALRDVYLRQIHTGTVQGPLTGIPSLDKPWLKYYPEKAILADYPKMTMSDYMYNCNINNLDVCALDYLGNKISYREFFENITKARKGFVSLGIGNGDVVTVASPFTPEAIYSIYALNSMGAVVNLVDPSVPEEKMLDYLSGANSRNIVILENMSSKVINIDKYYKLNSIVTFSFQDSSITPIIKSAPEGCISFRDVMNRGQEDFIAKYEENKPAIIVYTSGTSGAPKGAISSNESFNNMAHFQKESIINTNPGDSFLLIMPPFIAYGAAIGMHGQLCAGQTLIMSPSFNLKSANEMLGKLVSHYRPNSVMGVPLFYNILINSPEITCIDDMSFLKNCIAGGDGVKREIEEDFNDYMASHNNFEKLKKGWGLTEVNSCFSYTRDGLTNELGSVGVPLFGNNIRIVKPLPADITDEDFDIDFAEECTYGEVGEAIVKSPTVILDYLNRPSESKKVFFKSKNTGEMWIRTFDLARMTPDGIITIPGRIKRIIVRPDGHNIAPFAIESVALSDERIKDCAVVGMKSENHAQGEFATAFVVIKDEFKDDKEAILDKVIADIEAQLPPRDVASKYVIVDAIPYTSIGKVDYETLKHYPLEKELVRKRN